MANMISSLEKLNDFFETAEKPVVVQMASKTCERCPSFTEEVKKLKLEYDFEWVYVDVFESTDIVDEFGIAKLPAFIYHVHKNEAHNVTCQNASPSELRNVLQRNCRLNQAFCLDADF